METLELFSSYIKVSPQRFLNMNSTKYMDTGKVVFIPPNIGGKGFGYFKIKKDIPLLTVATDNLF